MVKSESDIIDTIHTGQVITDENGTQYFVCGKNRRDRRKFCVIDVPRQYENLRLSQE